MMRFADGMMRGSEYLYMYMNSSFMSRIERMKEVYSFHIDKSVKCHEQKCQKSAEKGENYQAKVK